MVKRRGAAKCSTVWFLSKQELEVWFRSDKDDERKGGDKRKFIYPKPTPRHHSTNTIYGRKTFIKAPI